MAHDLLTRRIYQQALNRVFEHIGKNLDQALRLEELAGVAGISPFHFHRLFSALVGEAPGAYIRRLRLERAAGLLIYQPLLSVTQVALGCGFGSSALLARAFGERFGVSPREWRMGLRAGSKKGEVGGKKGKVLRKEGKDADFLLGYPGGEIHSRRKRMKNVNVEVKSLPAMRLACITHLKGYEDAAGIGAAFERLFAWAGPRGYMGPEVKVVGMPLDDPEITEKGKCRYRACLTVGPQARPEGEVSIVETRPGAYAVAGFRGGPEIFARAYDYMYGEWLPGSGYRPDDAPAFEVYAGECEAGRFVFDLCLPVKPL